MFECLSRRIFKKEWAHITSTRTLVDAEKESWLHEIRTAQCELNLAKAQRREADDRFVRAEGEIAQLRATLKLRSDALYDAHHVMNDRLDKLGESLKRSSKKKTLPKKRRKAKK